MAADAQRQVGVALDVEPAGEVLEAGVALAAHQPDEDEHAGAQHDVGGCVLVRVGHEAHGPVVEGEGVALEQRAALLGGRTGSRPWSRATRSGTENSCRRPRIPATAAGRISSRAISSSRSASEAAATAWTRQPRDQRRRRTGRPRPESAVRSGRGRGATLGHGNRVTRPEGGTAAPSAVRAAAAEDRSARPAR